MESNSFCAMKLFSVLGVLLVLSGGVLQADQASLDRLVAKEQGNIDNEAVSVYGGKVGKLEAVFFIEFTGTGGRVDGWYYYPARGREKGYLLKGSNPKNGVLLLQEYTPKAGGPPVLSANCRLTKSISGGRITWSGKMNNTDGRSLTMSFSRKR